MAKAKIEVLRSNDSVKILIYLTGLTGQEQHAATALGQEMMEHEADLVELIELKVQEGKEHD